MLKLVSSFLAVILFMLSGNANSETTDRIAEVLKRPLIAGASVSAGYGTAGPGVRLCRRYTKGSNIKLIARGGYPGRDVIKLISPKIYRDRTVLIAVDFLFWDSTLSTTRASEEAFDRLRAIATTAHIPLIVGDIPELLPGRQITRMHLNDHIRKICKASQDCYILPLDGLHKRIMAEGFLEINGRRHSFHELVPDGLHLSELGSEYLADLMFRVLEDRATFLSSK